MHQFVDGEWLSEEEVTATNEEGEFERQPTTFRDRVEDDPDAEFPVEPGRYHLYVSYACPWAHRTLVTRALKGLEDAVSVDVVDPYRDEDGWQFTPGKAGCTPDTVNGFDYLREAYVAADPNYTGRVTVPVLWDRREGTIVNNESKEIMRMLDTAFDDLAARDVDLYPEGYRDDVDRIIEEIYEPINNGVYRAGFADTQEAYERAVGELFDALDRWEEVLETRRYLAGDRLTEADVAMFTTLIRFDDVYHTTPTTLRKVSDSIDNVQCEQWRQIVDYAHLYPYLRDLYQLPGVADTVHFDHISEHYGSPGSPPGFDPKRLPADELALRLEAPHERDELPATEPFGR
ncbi:glutathione S-transferase family protein [Halomarina pelagica]|uniref:glutathione S-transferase family protein n=1 Tax=Halomarina pelagica TaxID=2961599 RepID=UPI0020C423E5|nr:glutathione S-transferase C-terminal domain-containing protein [Halomarina sp. BND7]